MAELAVAVVLRAVDKISEPMRRIRKNTEKLSGACKSAGSAADTFSRRQETLRKRTEAANRVLVKHKLVTDSLTRLNRQVAGLASHLGNASSEAASLGIKLGVVAGLAGWGFKTQFVDTAAQFERFQTILETTEGSSEKARQAMQWVSEFATKTPYELAEVNEAFVKLRAYGMDPTQGLLMTLGNTSSAMGKDLMQAVEAVADAVTGENERLKEFGIKASTKGNTITYEYTNKAGEQETRQVDKNDRKGIQRALSEIFDQKYSGAMDRLSKTWSGMISNLSDQWTRFANMVMEAGVFDFMKSKLSHILATINAMADSGQLQAYARKLSESLITGLKALWRFGTAAVDVGRDVVWAASRVAEALGGWKPLLMTLTGLMAGKFLVSVLMVVKTLGGAVFQLVRLAKNGFGFLLSKLNLLMRAGSVLRVVFAASPIGLIITAVTAAVGLVMAFWQEIKAFGLGVVAGFREAAAPIKAMFLPLAPMFSALSDAIGWVVSALSSLFAPSQATAAELGRVSEAGRQFGSYLAGAIKLLLSPFGFLIDLVQQLATFVTDLSGRVTDWLLAVIPMEAAVIALCDAWKWVTNVVSQLAPIITPLLGLFDAVAQAAQLAGQWLSDAFTAALIPLAALQDAISWIADNLSTITGAADAVGGVMDGAWEGTRGAVTSALDWAFGTNDDEKDHSPQSPTVPPSTSAPSEPTSLPSITVESPSVPTAPVLSTPPSMTGSPSELTVSMPPAKPSPKPARPLMAREAPQQVSQFEQHNTITVVQQPGEDGEQLARRIVREEIKMKEQAASARQRGALFDYQESVTP
ncbi:tape measure protein [Veronia pacifica]|uniref:Tape measure protein N-terminal domain-containing protein n=1 Tax=Veronia pacifica TaxID=1080227 RepID=A0A1C3ELB6_9GAMM|nr:tape measure protein [Veronia pacifica]ODA34028.1 hypothetical protein A8L45_08255 [Veronia pacifica]